MSPRKKKPAPVPTPAEAAPEETVFTPTPLNEAPAEAPQTEEAPEGAARVEGVEPGATVETDEPASTEEAHGPAEAGEAGEVVEPAAWNAGAGTEEEFSGQGDAERPEEEAGGAVIEVIETEALGEEAALEESGAMPSGTATDEHEPNAEVPGEETPNIETIEASAAAESPDLEVSDEVEEPEGEVLDTELGRVLSTPTGLRSAIEALLFVTPEPLTPHRIARALEMNDSRLVMTTLVQLKNDYDDQKRGFQIIETAEGFQMATREVFGDLILRLKNRKRRPSLSQAALETLAIIAYRQPIIRAEVEAVRGVESSGTIRNLIDMGMVEMVGRKEVLGRPPMYGTTEQFLQSFGLRNLSDLPAIGELKRRLAENENKPAEPAKTPEAEAAGAAEGEGNPFQGDLPGQMYIEVPGAAAPEAGAPGAPEGNGASEAIKSQETQIREPDDEDAEPDVATLAAAADAPVPGGNEAAPDRNQETADKHGLEGNTMSDREKWETEEEDEDDEEFEGDEDWDDEDDDDEDEVDDDEDEDDDDLDEVDLEDEDDEDDEDDEGDEDEDEDDEDDEDYDEDEDLDEDEDEDENGLEDEDDEDEDEEPRPRRR